MPLRINTFKTIAGRMAFIVIPAVVGFVSSVSLLSYIFPKTAPGDPVLPVVIRDPSPVKEKSPFTSEVAYGMPVRLKIPSLNIDAPIDALGITTTGDMQSPSKPQYAGWYKFGLRPGQTGSAVIAGHYGSGGSKGMSVFDELHTLQAGSSIYIEHDNGVMSAFTMREFRTYSHDEVVADVFNSADSKAHLNLVTCKGDWDSTRQTYSHRLVLFADKK